jgi:hypothetical protein
MKFREHRGSLDDSMRTSVELGNHFADLCNHLRILQGGEGNALPVIYRNDQIMFKVAGGPDARIGWEGSVYVILDGHGVLGMVDRIPEGTPAVQVLPSVDAGVAMLAAQNEYKADEHVGDTQKHYFTTAGGEASLNDLIALAGATTTRADVPLIHATGSREPEHYDSVVSALPQLESTPLANGQHETFNGAEWLKKLRDMVANEDNDQALVFIDSLSSATAQTITPPAKVEPGQGAAAFAKLEDWAEDFGHPDFQSWVQSLPPHIVSQWKQADAGMVIVPDAEHMTEAMVDASRGLHLYYMEAGSGVRCDHMRKHLDRYAPWASKHYPQWFREDMGHLTKAGRAQIAHALTIGAYFDPDARAEYFAEAREQKGRIWDNPLHQRVRITFKPIVMGELFEGGGFVVYKRFMDGAQVGENKFLITLNRSDLPKEHRKKFKQTAVGVFMSLENEGREVVFGEVLVYPKLESSTFQVTPNMASRF